MSRTQSRRKVWARVMDVGLVIIGTGVLVMLIGPLRKDPRKKLGYKLIGGFFVFCGVLGVVVSTTSHL